MQTRTERPSGQFGQKVIVAEKPSPINEPQQPVEAQLAERQSLIDERVKRTWDSLCRLFHDSQAVFPGDRLLITPETIKVARQTKPTNIGLGILCWLGAEQAGLATSAETDRQIAGMLTKLTQLKRCHGFYYDWYDSKSGEKMTHWPDGGHELDQFLSSVDNAWLAISLLILKKAKPALAERIQAEILDQMDFEFFFDEESQELRGGYSDTKKSFADFHYPREFLSEPRIIHWLNAAMTTDREERIKILQRLLDKNGNIPAQLSGGALFELLMPRLLVRERPFDRVIQDIYDQHRAYGQQNLGGAIGISVTDDPNDGNYKEMGVGGFYPDASVVSSHGMALALLVDEESAWETLLRLEATKGFYDQHGYRDAIDVQNGRVAESQVFVNQAMVFLALLNCQGISFADLFEQYFTDEIDIAFPQTAGLNNPKNKAVSQIR